MMASTTSTPLATVDADELSCLAHGVFYEAAAEPMSGKIGVANVVLNRRDNTSFPSTTICGTLKEKGQFSYWKNTKKINLDNPKVRIQMEDAIMASAQVLAGEVPDNTNGALYFANRSTATDAKWIRQMNKRLIKTVKIANHTFYKQRGSPDANV
jgi:spore germination cell wall hydrolase CwlJ-like protein